MPLMGKIQLLSEETINQIAAGEVIKDPASVVKELIENALDAGATKITVEIAEGGLGKICVTDNGFGMEKEDALLCLQRHTTSKIYAFKDLFHLSTMGFRGEALASIAAISKLTLTTAVSTLGVKIEVEGGKILSQSRVSRAQGTTVEVRDLFYNVPARKKFQKSAPALSAGIFRLVTELALSAPSVHIDLFSKGKKALCIPPSSSFAERAELLIGSEFRQKSFALDFTAEGLKLKGLIGSPELSKANRLSQYLFLNGRFVHCYALGHAVREGYATRLDEKSHPAYLLYLDIAPELVDVNVHPEKKEVRLREERVLTQRVKEIVAGAFAPKVAYCQGSFAPPGSSSFSWEAASLKEEMVPAFERLDLRHEEKKILGLFGPYLLVEGSSVEESFDGLVLVDLRLAEFRVIYDQLLSSFQNKQQRAVSQILLLPLTLECTPVETAMLLTHQDAIESMGFLIRPAGKQLFFVEAIPPFLTALEVKEVIGELCALLQGLIGIANVEEQRALQLACATARCAKKRRNFNLEEAGHLMRQLASSTDSTYSPQGEKILIHLSAHELQKLFSH